jgi:MOSC domain-containing protein YiiM
MTGWVVSIFVAPASAATPAARTEARLDAGRGIVGDRYYDRNESGQVTLVDADAIQRVNAATGWTLTPEQTRRNIVTTGIDLNQWETGRFRLGGALLEGVELCEPCAVLGGILENESRSAAEVVRALTHQAGLRARIIEGAEISVGDPVRSA